MERKEKEKVMKEFMAKYKPFVEAKAYNLERSLGAKFSFDDARQEIMIAVWDAVNEESFDSNNSDKMSFIYKRVLWRTFRIIREETRMKYVADVTSFDDASEGDVLHKNEALLEEAIMARDWMERAAKEAEKLPVEKRAVVLACLKPKELCEHSIERRKKYKQDARAKYWVASTKDLIAYTGNDSAARDLKEAVVYLEQKLGHPFKDDDRVFERVLASGRRENLLNESTRKMKTILDVNLDVVEQERPEDWLFYGLDMSDESDSYQPQKMLTILDFDYYGEEEEEKEERD